MNYLDYIQKGEEISDLQDLQGLSLTKASLSGIDFSGANLSDTDFTDSDLGNANLNWATLKRVKLTHTNLVGAKMPDGRIHKRSTGIRKFFRDMSEVLILKKNITWQALLISFFQSLNLEY